MQRETCVVLGECCSKLLEKNSLFSKMRYISRINRKISEKQTREHKREELDTRVNLEIAVATLHDDVYNLDKQGEINHLRQILDGIETKKATGAAIQARRKWQKVGDKRLAEFLKLVRKKNSNVIMSELKDNHGQVFIRIENLERICYDFLQKTLPT